MHSSLNTSFNLSVYLPQWFHLLIYLSVYPSINLSISPHALNLSVHKNIGQFIRPYALFLIYLPSFLSIYPPSIRLFIYMPIHLSINLSIRSQAFYISTKDIDQSIRLSALFDLSIHPYIQSSAAAPQPYVSLKEINLYNLQNKLEV